MYGDHKNDHSAGFLEEKLAEFIPKYALKDKKSKEWENAIFKVIGCNYNIFCNFCDF